MEAPLISCKIIILMKRQYSFGLFLVLASMFLTVEANAQSFKGLDEAPHDISYYRESKATPPLIKVVYGRPQKNGKAVFGNIVPYGKIWRTGANEATEVKFYQDVIFGDQQIKAGTYVLYTIPNENEWEVILNSNTDVLGAFQYNPTFDVAKVKVPISKAEELDAFSIAFKERDNKVEMVLAWDAIRVAIPMAFRYRSAYASN